MPAERMGTRAGVSQTNKQFPNVFKTVQEIDTQGAFIMMSCAFEPIKASGLEVWSRTSVELHTTVQRGIRWRPWPRKP